MQPVPIVGLPDAPAPWLGVVGSKRFHDDPIERAMQPRSKPRSRIGCWTRCPIDIELQEDVNCLLALSVRELVVSVRPQNLERVLDPSVMALIELLGGLNGFQLAPDHPQLCENLFLRPFLESATLRSDERQRSKPSHDGEFLFGLEVEQQFRRFS